MGRVLAITAAFGLVCSGPAFAAQDIGLIPSRGGGAIGKSGMGVRLGASISLGGRKRARVSDRVAFSLNAGPSVVLQNSQRVRIRSTDMIGFRIKPGKSFALRAGGMPLATYYTRLGAAEQNAESGPQSEKPKKKGPSTLGWVAIGVGGAVVLVVALGALTLATCNYSFSDNCRGPSD